MPATRLWTVDSLAEMRAKARHSQRSLSKAAHVSASTISKLEKGENMSWDAAQKLAHVLDLEATPLFLAHNLAITACLLTPGPYISLAAARRDLQRWRDRLKECIGLTPHQYAIIALTMNQLVDAIAYLELRSLCFRYDWDEDEVLHLIQDGPPPAAIHGPIHLAFPDVTKTVPVLTRVS